uniref:Putative secreted protein n=1 Tax=Ixodes ricinus TaxID=34613 RepID=A0A6B0U0R2_IXORI
MLPRFRNSFFIGALTLASSNSFLLTTDRTKLYEETRQHLTTCCTQRLPQASTTTWLSACRTCSCSPQSDGT